MDSSSDSSDSLDTARIKDWRSIITLTCFFLANVVVLFPFHIPVPVPRALWDTGLSALAKARILRRKAPFAPEGNAKYIRLAFPMNFVTAPLIAVLFLLAILAIGQQEVWPNERRHNDPCADYCIGPWRNSWCRPYCPD